VASAVYSRRVSDAWDDEGFGPEDDREGAESVEADVEDEAFDEDLEETEDEGDD
jgi:hypothetical protein